jgi:hypothetical protein
MIDPNLSLKIETKLESNIINLSDIYYILTA